MKIFARITKVDLEKREVWGRAVQEVPDKAREIFDYESSVPYFKDWSAKFEKATEALPEPSLGNIRAMHGKVAAGKVIAIDFNDTDKAIDIGTKIVDDNEWQKCAEGVYTGFSIGGSYVKKWKDGDDPSLMRYTANPAETSLVDNPCVPTATFSVVKADGAAETHEFARYGLLKSALEAPDMKLGELLALTKEYLPDEAEILVKSENAIPDMLDRLRALVAGDEQQVEKVAAATDGTAASSETDTNTDAKPAESTEKAASTESAPESATPAAAGTSIEVAKSAAIVLVHKRLAKSMWDVRQLADVLMTIADMARWAESEKQWEQDASTVPADLRAWLAMGIALFKKMSEEELAELMAGVLPPGSVIEVVEIADALALSATGDLAKAGARHSKADTDKIQAVHDHAVGLGATCGDDAEKSTSAAVLIKVARDAEATSLAKVAELTTENESLSKRVKEFEALPLPAKGVTRVITVSKTDDTSDVTKTNEPPKPDPKNPLEVMKAVHAQGGQAVRL